MRNNLASIALQAVGKVLGEPITYTRGNTVVSARGTYQASHIGIDQDTGLTVNSRTPVLLVNRQDLPWDPRQGDLVEVSGGTFQVRDPQPDGHTGWLLMLHKHQPVGA
jgi:hypothetical protein